MSDKNSPTPIRVPSVDRATGKVTMPAEYAGQSVDGWASSENPWEGGLNAVNGFNDAMPEAERAKAVEDFNRKPANRII